MDLFWEKSGWQKEDRHLVALAGSPYRRAFPEIDVSLGPALYIVRGPRQVGKSSWLKCLLANFSDPKRAFYLSCENIEDYRDLSVLLHSLRNSRSLILLDEVSFVRDWTRAVKHEIDSGYKGVIVVTGSHAADLRAGADLFPGRFGAGRELKLLPMDFSEFISARRQAGWEELPRLEALRRYFRVGGMPAAVVEAGDKGEEPVAALETYERWILGDVVKLGKNKMYVQQVLGQFALCSSTPLSLQTLGRKTEIASHHTAQDYVQFLEDMFAVRTCYALDADTGSFKFRSQKKFYFTDPILYWIGLRLSGLPRPENWEAQLAEMVGFETLSRFAERHNHRLGYYSDTKGEVDYFSPKRWAIELKWSPVASGISKTFHRLAVPQKIVWTMENFIDEMPRTESEGRS